MLQQTNRGILLKIKLTPKASKNEIVGWENDELKIRIAGVPVKGEANEKLIYFLSKFFSIGKSKIELIQGHTGRHKVVCFSGVTLDHIKAKLECLLPE